VLNNPKILVLGSSGYIGSELVHALQKRGLKYAGLSKSPNNKSKFHIDLLECNINDLIDIFLSFDTVVGLSWYVNHEDYKTSTMNDKWKNTYINKILPAILHAGVKHFVGIGSCLEYGEYIEGPIKKSQIFASSNRYGNSKLQVSKKVKSLEKMMCTSWLRLFYVYGGNENSNKLIPMLCNNVKNNTPFNFKNPDIVNDYVHVEHVVKCIINIIETKKIGVFNIGSGKPIKNSDLYKVISGELNPPKLVGKFSGHFCENVYMNDYSDFMSIKQGE
jgi:nucleoside-diphosphate-sugar epimerase